MAAAAEGHLSAVRLLVEAGANLSYATQPSTGFSLYNIRIKAQTARDVAKGDVVAYLESIGAPHAPKRKRQPRTLFDDRSDDD